MSNQEICKSGTAQPASLALISKQRGKTTTATIIHLEPRMGYTGFPAAFKFYSKDSSFFDLSQAKDIPVLTPGEEIILARAIQNGDQDARAELWIRNIRLAMKIANRYRGRGLSFPELLSAGLEGIERATEDYDPDKFHTKFSTYATTWINQTIGRTIQNQGNSIRVPVSAQERYAQIQAMKKAFTGKFHREPTPEEIVAEIANPKITIETVVENIALVEGARNSLSLDHPVGNADKPLIDSVKEESLTLTSEEKYYTPEQEIINKQVAIDIKTDVDKAMEILRYRDQKVLELYFGLHGEGLHSLREIGEMLGISKEHARRVMKKALEELEESSYSKRLKIYLED